MASRARRSPHLCMLWAAAAWGCRPDLPGTMPISSDSAAPTIATVFERSRIAMERSFCNASGAGCTLQGTRNMQQGTRSRPRACSLSLVPCSLARRYPALDSRTGGAGMAGFLVSAEHTEADCVQALGSVLAFSKALLDRFDRGWQGGEERGWAVVEAQDKHTARMLIPSYITDKAE